MSNTAIKVDDITKLYKLYDKPSDRFKEALRDVVQPVSKFHHAHRDAPSMADMPDTTLDELPENALEFATFLKLEKPKAKSHPSRGNIH